jgi:hypothetical protein
MAQRAKSVRIHNFQCLNRSHWGRGFVPDTTTIREKGARDQGHSHNKLHDEVEIRPESGTGPEKALHWRQGDSTHFLYPPIRDFQ